MNGGSIYKYKLVGCGIYKVTHLLGETMKKLMGLIIPMPTQGREHVTKEL